MGFEVALCSLAQIDFNAPFAMALIFTTTFSIGSLRLTGFLIRTAIDNLAVDPIRVRLLLTQFRQVYSDREKANDGKGS